MRCQVSMQIPRDYTVVDRILNIFPWNLVAQSCDAKEPEANSVVAEIYTFIRVRLSRAIHAHAWKQSPTASRSANESLSCQSQTCVGTIASSSGDIPTFICIYVLHVCNICNTFYFLQWLQQIQKKIRTMCFLNKLFMQIHK